MFKERNYSRLRQFSERFFGQSIIRMQKPSIVELQNVLLSNRTMLENDTKMLHGWHTNMVVWISGHL